MHTAGVTPNLSEHCPLIKPADPEFRRPLRATFNFEKLQPMRLVVYDVDVREKDNRKLKLAEQVRAGCRDRASMLVGRRLPLMMILLDLRSH